MKEMLPKKISFIDKIRGNIRRILGYRDGTKYIMDIKPKIKKYSEVELMRIATIEEKLKKAIEFNKENQNIESGIEEKEAISLLEWTVQNARESFFRKTKDEEASLLGACGLGQAITGSTLKNMGLSPYIVNADPTLQKYTYRHAFVAVDIPIQQGDNIQNKFYLIDTTFRQFFLRDEVTNSSGDYIKDKKFGNRVASIPGYWMLKIKNGEQLAKNILANGFIELTEENAKIYGDAFTLSDRDRKNSTKVPTKKELDTEIEGKEYIQNIKSEQMQEEIDYDDEELKENNINIKTPLMLKMEIANTKYIPPTTKKDIEKEKPNREFDK